MLQRWPPKRTVTHRRASDPAECQWWQRRPGLDDWRQVSILRVIVPLILATVSFYYLTRWNLANAMPAFLAWTLPAALDITAYKAVKVALHPIDRWARAQASALAWLCVALSVAGNIGAHAIDLGIVHPDIWTISATAGVYPLMLAAGHIVAGKMQARPLTTEQEAEQAARKIAADEEVRSAKAAARRRQQRDDEAARPAPAAAPAPTPAPGPGRVAEQPDTEELLERAAAYMRLNPEAGRRKLADHLGITDHAAKQVHPAAKDAAGIAA